MMLTARVLEFEARRSMAILNRKDADDLDVKPSDRIGLKLHRKESTAIVNTANSFIKPGEIGLYGWVVKRLEVKSGDKVAVTQAQTPESIIGIRKKLAGIKLKPHEIRRIIIDTVEHRLSDIELASFITSLHDKGMEMSEIAVMSRCMAETGEMLNLGKPVFDKHSIGGVPGDKTSILVVPAVAAAGMTIPKTSSRAITSPAGTADRFECIAPVEFDIPEIRRIVRKAGGCMVWGGAVNMAPADDIFIKVEYPLSIDPMLLPSVMSKKFAVGAKYLVIDMPTGRGTKISTMGEASGLGNRFIELGERLGMSVSCVSTFGEQPLGHAMGPALEAREALQTLLTGRGPPDLIEKASVLAGKLFEFKGFKNPIKMARKTITSGKAGKKIKQIIEAQGGDRNIKPGDIPVGSSTIKVKATCSGRVWWISNHALGHICREAGAPMAKGAGIYLMKKLGDKVKKGDTILEIYAETPNRLKRATRTASSHEIIGIGERYDMVLARVPDEKHQKDFILER